MTITRWSLQCVIIGVFLLFLLKRRFELAISITLLIVSICSETDRLWEYAATPFHHWAHLLDSLPHDLLYPSSVIPIIT